MCRCAAGRLNLVHALTSRSKCNLYVRTNAEKTILSRRDLSVQRTPNIALLVDGDHVSPVALEPLLIALAGHGSVLVRRFYTVTHKADLWASDISKHGFEAVVVPRWAGGKKDAADMVMAMDAAELALRTTDCGAENISGIAIASDDLDFGLLLMRIRAWGLKAYAVVPSPDGSELNIHVSARRVWKDVDAVIVPYEFNKRRCSESVVFDSQKFIRTPIESSQSAIHENRYAELVALLKSHRYLPKEMDRLHIAAVVKFLHVNTLGPCAILPKSLMEQQLSAIVARSTDAQKKWLPDPGNLVLLDRIRKGENNDTMRSLRAGGPVLLLVGPTLVQEVLIHLSFLHGDSNIFDDIKLHDALRAFVIVNRQRLAKDHGLSLDDVPFEAVTHTSQQLHDVFAAQTSQQRWRIMLSDTSIRQKLLACGVLKDVDAPREEVLDGMICFLKRRGAAEARCLQYQVAVLQCAEIMIKRSPEKRI